MNKELKKLIDLLDEAGFHIDRIYEEENRDVKNKYDSDGGLSSRVGKTGAICLRITPEDPVALPDKAGFTASFIESGGIRVTPKKPAAQANPGEECVNLRQLPTIEHHSLASELETADWPISPSVIPNYMGINLCSVEGMSWRKQPDGQLVDLTIHFIPAPQAPVMPDNQVSL
jgi:hypothetical protein